MKKVLMAVIAVALVAMAGSAMAADSTTVTVTANVAGTCKFRTGGTIAFTLDPGVGGDVAGTVSAPTFWCSKGLAYTITDDNGENETGTTHRMERGSTGEYIPYTFDYTATGNGTGAGIANTLTLNLTSTVYEADYLNATNGLYTDIVTLSINP